MKIILKDDVYNLGEEGDICDVARGYARNYLIPKGYAVPDTKENRAVFESRRASIEKRKEEKRKAAQGLKERLEGMELVLPMNVGEGGKLFGSVTSAMIIEALDREGIGLEKKQVDVPSNSMKMTGTYKVLVKLYESESAEITVKVVDQNRPHEEAEPEEGAAGEAEEAAAGEPAEDAGPGEAGPEEAGPGQSEAEEAGASAGVEVPAEPATGESTAEEESAETSPEEENSEEESEKPIENE